MEADDAEEEEAPPVRSGPGRHIQGIRIRQHDEHRQSGQREQNRKRAPKVNYLQAINTVIKLSEDKKINKENAFDVQITSLEHLKEYLN